MTQPNPSPLEALTNLEFLQAIFGPDWGNAHITGFPEPPDALNDIDTRRAWAGWLAKNTTVIGDSSGLNTFFCISTFHQQENEKPRRRKALHERTYCIVVDDVGWGDSAKVNPESLRLPYPSWKLETSPGNEQWGYILDPYEANAWRVDALLNGLVKAGIVEDGSDPGMKGVTRYIRLPQGINNKTRYDEPFKCKLNEWQPARIFPLDDLAACYGIDVQTEPDHTEHTSNPLPENDDPFLAAFHEAGIYKSTLGEGRYDIVCPWIEQHSDRVDSGTAYLSPNGFKCHHGHCEDKTFTDLHIWLENARPGLLRRCIIEGDAKRPKGEERPENMPEVPVEPGKRTYPLIAFGDVQANIDTCGLIEGVIGQGTMVVTYGESNSGKTFIVLDMSICVAAGMQWHGRDVEQGLVIYVAAEGGHSISNRIAAYRAAKFEEAQEIPFFLMPCAIDLLDPEADTKPIIEFVKQIEEREGQSCVMIVIDTLSRALSGGNENSPEDMGGLVNNADMIRHALDCTLHFVHHSGKDTAKGARGHSLLRAASDTELEVTDLGSSLHKVKATKQRDFETETEFAYRLNVVELGVNPKGVLVTTCVPEWIEGDALPARNNVKLTKAERAVIKAMEETLGEGLGSIPTASLCNTPSNRLSPDILVMSGNTVQCRTLARGISETDNPDSQARTFRRSLQSLQSKGIIKVFEDWTWFTDIPDIGRTF